LKEIKASKEIELQIIATGMHLSPEFGLTYKKIEQDGFTINRKVEMLISSDSETGICKSMGLGMIGFADAFTDLQPDMLVVLGDRFEIFSAVSAAMILKIPVAHLHGGETTEGAFDEAIRHSITKMSHLHFCATDEYRKRIIQLGEHPDRVFNVGAAGIENIRRLELLDRIALEDSLQFKLGKQNLLITFHPVTLEDSTAKQQFTNLLAALDQLEETHLIFTKSNADTEGRSINKMIEDYVENHSYKAVAFTSLGQLRYLSSMQYIDGVVGNSSSGLLEAPSFKIGTINIGDRQRGRIKSSSVIDCHTSEESIMTALKKLFSLEFKQSVKHVRSPYGGAYFSKKVVEKLVVFSLKGILKKKFHDL